MALVSEVCGVLMRRRPRPLWVRRRERSGAAATACHVGRHVGDHQDPPQQVLLDEGGLADAADQRDDVVARRGRCRGAAIAQAARAGAELPAPDDEQDAGQQARNADEQGMICSKPFSAFDGREAEREARAAGDFVPEILVAVAEKRMRRDALERVGPDDVAAGEGRVAAVGGEDQRGARWAGRPTSMTTRKHDQDAEHHQARLFAQPQEQQRGRRGEPGSRAM